MSYLPTDGRILGLTAEIVSAHVSHNSVTTGDLPVLIISVHRTLTGADAAPAAAEIMEPAVSVEKSVFSDHVVCLDCGKSFSMMRRHLQADHGMSPRAYRVKWGLPNSYPIVSPDYTKHRSLLAKSIGLGRRRETQQSDRVAPPEAQPPNDAVPRKAGVWGTAC